MIFMFCKFMHLHDNHSTNCRLKPDKIKIYYVLHRWWWKVIKYFCENNALQLFSVLVSILPNFYEQQLSLKFKQFKSVTVLLLQVTLWETKVLTLIRIGLPRSSLYWSHFLPPVVSWERPMLPQSNLDCQRWRYGRSQFTMNFWQRSIHLGEDHVAFLNLCI